MSEAIKRRDSLKKSLNRFNKLAGAGNAPMTVMDAKVYLDSLEKYFDLYLEAQLAVDEVTGKESVDFEEIELTNMEKIYLSSKLFLNSVIEAATPPPPPPVVMHQQPPNAQNVQYGAHPPQINTKMKI